MAIYRYSSESIDSLCRKARRHHMAAFAIFTAAVCVGAATVLNLRAALIYDATFSLFIGVILFRTRHKARDRTAALFRSTEIEIDEEKASYRCNLRETTLRRSEIVEARFSDKGIWLRGKSRRATVQFPAEFEGFDQLPAILEGWLPEYVIRRNTLPSSIGRYLQVYGIWAGAALLLYAAMAIRIRAIAIPACVVTGTGTAWYFAWCGRKINERKWKVLLPLSGYLAAAIFLGRAFELFLIR
jgi:hypothetical protein